MNGLLVCKAVFVGPISGLKLNVLLVWPVSLCQKATGYEKAFDFDPKDAPGKIAMKTDY